MLFLHSVQKVVIALLMVLLLSGCRDSLPRLQPLAPDAVILAFGDSLTAGYGAAPQESYPAVLQQLTGRRVVNRGISGEVSAEGLQRLPAELSRFRPDLVILCHGGNDLLRRQPAERLTANLEAMIELIRADGAQVLLVGVPQPGLRLRTAPLYEELARRLEVPYEGRILRDILDDNGLKSDTIHPNMAGYRRLAEALAGHLP